MAEGCSCCLERGDLVTPVRLLREPRSWAPLLLTYYLQRDRSSLGYGAITAGYDRQLLADSGLSRPAAVTQILPVTAGNSRPETACLDRQNLQLVAITYQSSRMNFSYACA